MSDRGLGSWLNQILSGDAIAGFQARRQLSDCHYTVDTHEERKKRERRLGGNVPRNRYDFRTQ